MSNCRPNTVDTRRSEELPQLARIFRRENSTQDSCPSKRVFSKTLNTTKNLPGSRASVQLAQPPWEPIADHHENDSSIESFQDFLLVEILETNNHISLSKPVRVRNEQTSLCPNLSEFLETNKHLFCPNLSRVGNEQRTNISLSPNLLQRILDFLFQHANPQSEPD